MIFPQWKQCQLGYLDLNDLIPSFWFFTFKSLINEIWDKK